MNMDTKLCRICGKLSENYVHIFKTEGLKNKIETCLPIIVSPHCLLPDTICSECLENVDNFYSFIKNCLQNIIVLEAQYDIMESCLKTKRKHEKGSFTDFTPIKYDKNVQTDEDFADLLLQKEENHRNTLHFNYIEMEKLSAALLNAENILNGKEPDAYVPTRFNSKGSACTSGALVSYEVETEGDSEQDDDDHSEGRVILVPKNRKLSYRSRTQRKYFDDVEIDLIDEIAQRKSLKRKFGNDAVLSNSSKVFKIDTGNRRKNRQPKKLEPAVKNYELPNLTFNSLESFYKVMHNDRGEVGDNEDKQTAARQAEKEEHYSLPQLCLLCDLQFSGPTTLAAHIYEMHGIDMAQVISSEPVMERKKKLPNLVKIADLKIKNEIDASVGQTVESPPTLRPTFVCPICPAVLTNRSDLFSHLKAKHPRHASLLCGLCMHVSNSFANLTSHLDVCKPQHAIASKYICKICSYYDDNSKAIENHVAVHDFVLEFCKKQSKMFDPCDYIELNKNSESANKSLTCTECNQSGFSTFKEFSTHRRSQHQIFHCDLCNKFYGRNSHLWKHVNRLHKGHPSITCQLCYKTSASKYHLSQHFNKIHSAKPLKQKQDVVVPSEDGDFMNQKFQGFDFQSVRQSFMRQELLEQDANSDEELETKIEIKDEPVPEIDCSDFEMYANDHEDESKATKPSPPKEIDSTSDLYTNIITNYTPPQNEGEYKCPKCFKGFHKKTLLKKHKKNCRPRLQKDLLTRCKTCSRIFKDRQSLTKHLINYHSEYACEICGQKVQSKCEIVSHIRFSHPNCHLFCHCGNILRSKLDLVEHKKDHRNSFVCQFCADMLPTKIKLKMHILSLHRKILSLSCGICLKLFETQHILRDHVCLVHKDQLLPLTSCTVCGKNYGSKWKTYDHLNKSHGRIFKACKSCLEVFDTEIELQKHFENAHGGQAKTVAPKLAPSAEENGDKNSTSEASNDSFVPDQCEDEEVPDLGSVESRISLLEKRLTGGKKTVDGCDPVVANAILTTLTKNKLNSPLLPKQSTDGVKKEKKISRKETAEPSDLDSSLQNTSQNSSKRTVYVNSNDPSFCEICLKTWPAKKHLWQHYIRRHKTVAATVCGICLKTNDSYKALQTHLWENHPKLLHGQGFGSNFICRICGRYHNASSKLRLHMAIHENFDWSILDGLDAQKDAQSTKKELSTSNGFLETSANDNPSINYESLIEQVECSSNTDESDMEDCAKGAGTYLPSNDNVNSSSEDESDSESVMSATEGNSLESQMLHNMLREKFVSDVKVEPAEEAAVDKLEYSSSDSEESSDTNDTASETEPDAVNMKTTSDDESSQFSRTSKDSEPKFENIFTRKSDELDSAIRSISYEQIDEVRESVPIDIGDVHPQILNQHEIQSAVDSIL